MGWEKHREQLPVVFSILTLKATVIEATDLGIPKQYQGLDRFKARDRIVGDLRAQALLVSEKPYKLRVPRSGRTVVVVEPMLTDQLFVKMAGLAQARLGAVARGVVKVFHEHWTGTYHQSLENIHDWCIP